MTQQTINDAVKGLHALADIISELGPQIEGVSLNAKDANCGKICSLPHAGIPAATKLHFAAVGFKTAADGTDGALGGAVNGALGDRPLPNRPLPGRDIPSEEVINSTSAADVPNSEEKDETKGEERDLPPLDSPIEKEAGKKAGKEEPPSIARARGFVKPTPEEIAAYAKERGITIDAEAFFDFYESKGWKVGKNTMKDWRAAVRTWVRRDREDKVARTTPAFTGTRASNWRGTRKEDLDDVLG